MIHYYTTSTNYICYITMNELLVGMHHQGLMLDYSLGCIITLKLILITICSYNKLYKYVSGYVIFINRY